MIEILWNFVNFFAGVIVAGLGFTVTLAGLKIMYTGIGWLI